MARSHDPHDDFDRAIARNMEAQDILRDSLLALLEARTRMSIDRTQQTEEDKDDVE